MYANFASVGIAHKIETTCPGDIRTAAAAAGGGGVCVRHTLAFIHTHAHIHDIITYT